MPPSSRSVIAEQAAPEPEPVEEAPAVDETPEPVADAEPAGPVVTAVKVREACTVARGCELIRYAAGELAYGDAAVYLAASGAPVDPIDED